MDTGPTLDTRRSNPALWPAIADKLERLVENINPIDWPHTDVHLPVPTIRECILALRLGAAAPAGNAEAHALAEQFRRLATIYRGLRLVSDGDRRREADDLVAVFEGADRVLRRLSGSTAPSQGAGDWRPGLPPEGELVLLRTPAGELYAGRMESWSEPGANDRLEHFEAFLFETVVGSLPRETAEVSTWLPIPPAPEVTP